MFLKKSLSFCSIILITVGISFGQSVPDSTLVAHWTFSSTGVDYVFQDISKNNHDLIVTENAANVACLSGPFGKYCKLNNSGASMRVRNSSTGSFNFDNFSIMAYVKIPQNEGVSRTIFQSCQYVHTEAGYRFGITSGRRLFLRFPNSPVVETYDVTLNPDEMTHVAVTFDGTNAYFYINGTLCYTGRPEMTSYAKSAGLAIVGEFQGGIVHGDNFIGDIDEIRIYKRSLSESEISDIVNN